MLSWTLKETSSNKRGYNISRKSVYWFPQNCSTITHSSVRQSSVIVDQMFMPQFCWNEECQITWGLSNSHLFSLWKLYTPLLVNVALTVHNAWHKRWGSSTVLCWSHWQSWRQKLLSFDYSPCTCYNENDNNCSSCSVYQPSL